MGIAKLTSQKVGHQTKPFVIWKNHIQVRDKHPKCVMDEDISSEEGRRRANRKRHSHLAKSTTAVK